MNPSTPPDPGPSGSIKRGAVASNPELDASWQALGNRAESIIKSLIQQITVGTYIYRKTTMWDL